MTADRSHGNFVLLKEADQKGLETFKISAAS
jgi:hypothetical protein